MVNKLGKLVPQQGFYMSNFDWINGFMTATALLADDKPSEPTGNVLRLFLDFAPAALSAISAFLSWRIAKAVFSFEKETRQKTSHRQTVTLAMQAASDISTAEQEIRLRYRRARGRYNRTNQQTTTDPRCLAGDELLALQKDEQAALSYRDSVLQMEFSDLDDWERKETEARQHLETTRHNISVAKATISALEWEIEDHMDASNLRR
ncbi:hypothetical protein [Phaeobacter italicus]|uniref:hypothetical protein n=1 Tax=Phaeobacter italicus TaxID=481446 RepID=UPI001CD61872|nr:hypothetical protein [Phaeobacter italicus]MCA0855907.1 hypothetical protein [Phaeobacter italicus]